MVYELLIPGQCFTAVDDHQLSTCAEKEHVGHTERQTAVSTMCYSHLKEGTPKRNHIHKSVRYFLNILGPYFAVTQRFTLARHSLNCTTSVFPHTGCTTLRNRQNRTGNALNLFTHYV